MANGGPRLRASLAGRLSGSRQPREPDVTRRTLLGSLPAIALCTPAIANPARTGAFPTVGNATTVGEIPMGGAWTRFDTSATEHAWPRYLRSLPLWPEGTPVLDYRGKPTGIPALRAVNLPLVRGDLQQCADTVLRLRATFVRQQGGDPAFRYTSGWVSNWSAWAAGKRPQVSGNVVTVSATGKIDNSDTAFEAWLTDLFMYAGTHSLVKDTVAVDGGTSRLKPGDIVVYGGSPGHAVVLLDSAVDSQGGEYVLVGQGFMPAQSFHICPGPHSGWFAVSGDTLPTLPLSMPWGGLRRFA